MLIVGLVLAAGIIPATSAPRQSTSARGDDTNCDARQAGYPGSGDPVWLPVKNDSKGVTLVDSGGTVYVAAGTYTAGAT